jgi:hypothetical protein
MMREEGTSLDGQQYDDHAPSAGDSATEQARNFVEAQGGGLVPMNPQEQHAQRSTSGENEESLVLLSTEQLDALLATTVVDDDLELKARYDRFLVDNNTNAQYSHPENANKGMITSPMTSVPPEIAVKIPLPPRTLGFLNKQPPKKQGNRYIGCIGSVHMRRKSRVSERDSATLQRALQSSMNSLPGAFHVQPSGRMQRNRSMQRNNRLSVQRNIRLTDSKGQESQGSEHAKK